MKNLSTKTALSSVFIALFGFFSLISSEESDDPVMEYYIANGSGSYASRHPLKSGLAFSFEAKTYYKLLNDDAVYVLIDSSISHYYFSFGQIDSVKQVVKPEESFDSLAVDYPNVFQNYYIYNFFPNDTGSESISIGFDSPTFPDSLPVGLIVMDRDQFYLEYLYLYHLNEKKFKRWSRGYRFVEMEGYVIPDSIWTIKSRRKLLGNEHYRYETGITGISIYR